MCVCVCVCVCVLVDTPSLVETVRTRTPAVPPRARSALRTCRCPLSYISWRESRARSEPRLARYTRRCVRVSCGVCV